MSDRRLTAAFRGVAEAMLPDEVLGQERSLRGMLNTDSTIRLDALVQTLPWAVRDVTFSGTVATGADVARLVFPQGARIRHVAIAARVGPSGGPFGFTLTGADRSESFSLPAGQTTTAAGVDIAVSPGAFVGISVTAVNGAEDITISIHSQGGQP